MPDIIGIFLYASVGGEISRCGDIPQGHLIPGAFVVGVELGDFLLRTDIGFVIRHTHIGIGDGRARKEIIGNIRKGFAAEPYDKGFNYLADYNTRWKSNRYAKSGKLRRPSARK